MRGILAWTMHMYTYFGLDEGGWPSFMTYSLPQKTAIGHSV